MKGAPLLTLLIGIIACERSQNGWSSANALAACPSAARSPWHHDSVVARDSFGTDAAFALGIELWGVASNGSDVFVFDAQNTRIIRLDERLAPITQFGRTGSGPGEFRFQRVGDRDWLAASDSLVHAIMPNGIVSFNLNGEHQQTVRIVSDSNAHLSPTAIRRISFEAGRLILVEDDIDFATAGRTLRVWRQHGTVFGQEAEFRMPDLPRAGGRPTAGTLIRQADPLFAIFNQCFIVNDGSSQTLLRGVIGTSAYDTLTIPALEPPPAREADERAERRMAELRRQINAAAPSVNATAPLRWSKAEIDPAGYAWLQLWRPASYADEPAPVVIVDLATGRTIVDTIPAFPVAFLSDGVILSLDRYNSDGIPRLRTWAPLPGSTIVRD